MIFHPPPRGHTVAGNPSLQSRSCRIKKHRSTCPHQLLGALLALWRLVAPWATRREPDHRLSDTSSRTCPPQKIFPCREARSRSGLPFAWASSTTCSHCCSFSAHRPRLALWRFLHKIFSRRLCPLLSSMPRYIGSSSSSSAKPSSTRAAWTPAGCKRSSWVVLCCHVT